MDKNLISCNIYKPIFISSNRYTIASAHYNRNINIIDIRIQFTYNGQYCTFVSSSLFIFSLDNKIVQFCALRPSIKDNSYKQVLRYLMLDLIITTNQKQKNLTCSCLHKVSNGHTTTASPRMLLTF